MLVLSRRKDETIMIGDSVEITVVDVRGDTVRIGITAPRNVSVHRKEVYDAIQAENIAAAQEATPTESSVDGLGSLLKKSGSTAGAATALAGGKLSALDGLSKLSGALAGGDGQGTAPLSSRSISKFADQEGPLRKKPN